MAKIEIKDGRIIIDGKDLTTMCTGFTIGSSVEEFGASPLICRVALDLIGEAEIEAEAIISLNLPDGNKYQLRGFNAV